MAIALEDLTAKAFRQIGESGDRFKLVCGTVWSNADQNMPYDRQGDCQKRIVLVDDVLTTGTTVNECAKTLWKAGAEAVYVRTIAREI